MMIAHNKGGTVPGLRTLAVSCPIDALSGVSGKAESLSQTSRSPAKTDMKRRAIRKKLTMMLRRKA